MEKASLNQLGNTKNPHQTDAKRVLCICSAGLLRSPSIANVLHNKFGHNTRAAGISTEYALIPVSEALIRWADEIVFAEVKHLRQLELAIQENKLDYLIPIVQQKACVLEIPDRYAWMDPDLQEEIEVKYKKLHTAPTKIID